MAATALPEWQNFMLGSVSPALACVFSNPFEVAKVRKQMDGELSAKTSGRYRGTFLTLSTIYHREGVQGLQAGLPIAVFREGSKNLFRIGAYLPILNRLHTTDDPIPVSKRILAGACSGSLGALVCNPIEIVKTRMQAHILNPEDSKNWRPQYEYRSVRHGFVSLAQEEGVLGMWKKSTLVVCDSYRRLQYVVVSMARSAIITAINLPCYTMLKQYGLDRGYDDGLSLHIPISLIAAWLAIVGNNPLDVLRNRLYNQREKLYANAFDAVQKIVRTEGWGAFYKGFWQHYLRSAPHLTLTFVFFEQFSQILRRTQGLD